MKRFAKTIGIALLLALLAGCGASGPVVTLVPTATTARSASAFDTRAAQADTRFGINLFQQMHTAAPNRNLFISPASAALALSLAYNGARGETQAAMAKALQLQGLSVTEVNRANAALASVQASSDPKVQLNIANSIWYRKDLKLNSAFTQAVQGSYRAELHALDFARSDSATTINGWVDKATAGKIPTIIDQIDPQKLMYLINAVYFKGAWTEPFDPARTKPAPFHLLNGNTVSVPLMGIGGEFRHYQGDGFQAVSLPYGNERFSMYIFLPDPGSSLDSFCAGITADHWEQWMSAFKEQTGSLLLPRVKLEYQSTLNDALQALGMAPAFQPSADFGNLFQDPAGAVFIDTVLQKTYLDINETGTEAAAVTAVMTAGAARPVSPFSMVVDRPFFLAIRDNQTGLVLFMGAIVDPTGPPAH